MNLKGGVIIIGSLIWKDHLNNDNEDNIRKNWREQNLNKIPISTKVPIRYGRESGEKRKHTYTMIFSKYCEDITRLGQGIILSFNNCISCFEDIERQSIALAISEGIYKHNNKRLTSSWGSVGLIINPALRDRDVATYEIILKKWSEIYNKYADTFDSNDYKTDLEIDTEIVITQNGFLNINWQSEMNDFDLLIATPTIPKPKDKFLTPSEIAKKIKETRYDIYFNKNRNNKIFTFQDDCILKFLNQIE